MKTPLTIIIPAKHEEETILTILAEIQKRVKTSHRIIVVNDSDTGDRTGTLAKTYAKNRKNISVIVKRRGYATFGSALALGFRAVKNGVVVPVMADLCDELESIDIMYKRIVEGWDVVCGSRYMRGAKKSGGPRLQSISSTIVCFTLRKFLSLPTSDVSNAFKMYRKKALERIRVDPTSGTEASMAITLHLYFSGATITDIPTKWTGSTKGVQELAILTRAPRYIRLYLWALLKG